VQEYKVSILPIAKDDIANIYYYIAPENPDAALKLTSNILKQIDTLAIFPTRCPLIRHVELAGQQYRMLIVDNYNIFFKILGDDVIVFRVLHSRRDYLYLLEQE